MKRSRRWLPGSLAARITGGVVVLVVVLLAMLSAAMYLLLRSYLVSRLDQQLAGVVTSNANRLAHCLAEQRPQCDLAAPGDYQTPTDEWLTVLTPKGTPFVNIAASDSLHELDLAPAVRRAVVHSPQPVRAVAAADGSQLRISARAVQTPDRSFVVVSGLSTGELRNTLRRMIGYEALISGAAVLVAIFATTYGVRFGLRGLRQVTTTAQGVAAELSPEGRGLDRRVPVTEEDSEVGQLAESMNTLLGAVEMQFAARLESERRMRQFLADASHELRTPLTSIRGYAELARMQRAAAGGAGTDDNLERIESEGTRMSRLVEDLLLLARGDANESHLAEKQLVDVGELLDDAVNGVRAAVPEREIVVDVMASPHVVGDRDQLLRVVRNLVTNAAVHTAPGRPIHVRCGSVERSAVLQVIDGGPGLPPEEAAHVFERFWRADKARTRGRGGSGLGLSIVASIVRAHGGDVRFESTVEGGSTVTVWLPLASTG